MRALHRQRGAALLLALVITAIAATLAAGMVFDNELQFGRSTQVAQQERAWQLAAGMEEWALALLDRDAELAPLWDGPGDAWTTPLPPTPVPGGEVSGRITDLAGRINLNGLLRPDGTDDLPAVRRFRRLVVDVLALDPAIVDQLLDRLDADAAPRPLGHEPGAGAGRPGRLAHEAELRELPAVSDEAWAALAPFVAALPRLTRLNVNTAPAPVRMALADGIGAELAERIAPRPGAPWTSIAEFAAQPALEDIALDLDGLAVASGAFRAEALIVLDGTPLRFASVIFRGGGSSVSRYHVRNRSLELP